MYIHTYATHAHHTNAHTHTHTHTHTVRLITSPNNASVTPGESTNLTCVFQSSNTLDVNWFKDNVNITNDGRFMTQITRSAAGTYTSMEQFDSTSLHDCGKYYCMAVSQKIACSVFASTAILQVIGKQLLWFIMSGLPSS